LVITHAAFPEIAQLKTLQRVAHAARVAQDGNSTMQKSRNAFRDLSKYAILSKTPS